jgi:hypothetical protein
MAPEWKKELDGLVVDTLAFVNSVKHSENLPEAQPEPGAETVVAVVNQALADSSVKAFAPMAWPAIKRGSGSAGGKLQGSSA